MENGTRIVRSSAYLGLDPSEKSSISYYLGLALTKAFAEKVLDTPYLMHLDVYRERFNLHLLPRGGRPDLFGQDRKGRWIIAESKGRTNGFDAAALKKAKKQSQQVTSIDGTIPFLRIGLVASFRYGKLELSADDPPAEETPPRSIALRLSNDEFKAQYYAPFRALLDPEPGTPPGGQRELVRVGNRRAEAIRFDNLDLVIGLLEAKLGKEFRAPQLDQPIRDVGERSYLGSDGILVELGPSWRDDMMRREPQLRMRGGG